MAAFEVPLNSIVWPYRANWREKVETGYEYKTTVKVSQNGKEQRRALRSQPRRSMEVLTSGLELREFQNLQRFVFENLTRPIAMPDFASVVIAEVTSETTLAINDTAHWAQPGNAVIIASEGYSQLAHVEGADPDEIALTVATGLTGKVRLYPALYGHFSSPLKGKLLTQGVMEASTSLNGLPGLQNPVYEGAPAVMFDGREVLLRKMDWASRSVDFSGFTKVLDNGRGRVSRYNPIRFNTRAYRQNFLLDARADREDLLAFFCRMKGRRGEFFAPTWTDDLTLKSNTELTLRCEGTGQVNYAANRVDRALMVEMDDGRRGFAKVTNAVQTNGDLVINLAAAFPWPIAPDRVSRLCWLPLCRFGSDELNITHLSSVTATADMTIQTLEYLAAE